MKTTKKLLSFVMAVVMVVTMCAIGFTASAGINVTPTSVTVTVVVPELIYLTPGANTFQYYIGGVINGNTPSATKTTTGSIEFTVGAGGAPVTNISVAASGATVAMTQSSTATTLSATVNSGSMASVADGVVTWTFSYDVSGVTYYTYAYSYVYAPYMGQVGTAGYANQTYGTQSAQWGGYFFMVGIHSVGGGKYNSNLLAGASTATNFNISGYTGTNKSPLAPGWVNADAIGWTTRTNRYQIPQHFSSASGNTGGINNVQYYEPGSDSAMSVNFPGKDNYSDDTYWGHATGYLTLDSSRYIAGSTNLNTVPNLAGGWMLSHAWIDGSNQHWVNQFNSVTSGEAIDGVLQFKPDGDNYYPQVNYGSVYGPYAPQGTATNKVPTQSTTYNMRARVHHRAQSTNKTLEVYYRWNFRIDMVNKANLRTTLNNTIYANYQEADYTTASWGTYIAALQDAATVLGKPQVTQLQIDNALAALTSAVAGLSRVSYTVTVIHKLPAENGFQYTYNSQTYTASGGYVTITETDTFLSGYNVSVSTNTFPGYTLTDSETYVFRRADVTKTYYYTAINGTLNFVYGSAHEAYITGYSSLPQTKQVTYGQVYGTLPAPQMDGWYFRGWYDSSNTRVWPENLYNLTNGAAITLTARWECAFAGGDGVLGDPFLVETPDHLALVDDPVVTTTVGKYYKQIADIEWKTADVPVANFSGNYNGNNFTIRNTTARIDDDTAAGMFGVVNGAVISNLNFVNEQGISANNTTGDRSAGFIAVLNNSTLDNVHATINSGTVRAQGSAAGGNTGFLVGIASNSVIEDSSVTLNGGVLSNAGNLSGQNAFIGTVVGTVTQTNTWTFIRTQPTGYQGANSSNVMRVGGNGSATMVFNGTQFEFTATPASGYSTRYREGQTTIIQSGNAYSPSPSLAGVEYNIAFVKSLVVDVNIAHSAYGTVTGAGTYYLAQGDVLTGIVAVPATGYRFTTWALNDTANGTVSPNISTAAVSYTMSTNGGRLTAQFSVITYYVQYNANLPQGVSPDNPPPQGQTSRTWGQQVLIPQGLTAPGYTFLYWCADPNGDGTPYYPQSTPTNLSSVHDDVVTLYAIWDTAAVVYHTVTFATNGANESIDPRTVANGGTFVFDETVTKTGYVFAGWFTDQNCSIGYQAAGSTSPAITGPVIYYAKWNLIKYTIIYSAAGATNVPTNQIVEYIFSGSFNLKSDVPVKSGFDFLGWDTDPDATTPQFTAGGQVTTNLRTTDGDSVTLYAIWIVAAPTPYTVTWDLNGGQINNSSANPTSLVTNDGTYTYPSGTLSHPGGKIFVGWYTATTGGTEVANGSSASGLSDHITFYAIWRLPQYTINFDKTAGDADGDMESITVDSDAYLPENTFERSGYDFDGWALSAEDAIAEISVCADEDPVSVLALEDGDEITLYAVWHGLQVRVTYRQNGGTGANMQISTTTMGATITLRKNSYSPPTDSHTFGGWALSPTGEAIYEDEDPEFTPPYYVPGAVGVELWAVWNLVPVTGPVKLIPHRDGQDQTDTTTIIDYDKKLIYGLKKGINRLELENEFLAVDGNGYFTVQEGTLGTGKTVTLKSNTDPLFEEIYYLVIFGDVTGDGAINSVDVAEVNKFILDNNSVAALGDSSSAFFFAADLLKNGAINTNVANVIKQAASGREIDQQTGAFV